MIIPINENWRLRSDRHQWIVEQRMVPSDKAKQKAPYWVGEAYYSTIESAAVGLYELRLRLSDAEGIREATEAAKALSKELQDALSPHVRLVA